MCLTTLFHPVLEAYREGRSKVDLIINHFEDNGKIKFRYQIEIGCNLPGSRKEIDFSDSAENEQNLEDEHILSQTYDNMKKNREHSAKQHFYRQMKVYDCGETKQHLVVMIYNHEYDAYYWPQEDSDYQNTLDRIKENKKNEKDEIEEKRDKKNKRKE